MASCRPQPGLRRPAPHLHHLWAQVPDAIKSQYQNPPPTLLPAAVRQLELVCSGVPDCQASRHLTTEAEQAEVAAAGRLRRCRRLVFPTVTDCFSFLVSSSGSRT